MSSCRVNRHSCELRTDTAVSSVPYIKVKVDTFFFFFFKFSGLLKAEGTYFPNKKELFRLESYDIVTYLSMQKC